MGKNFPPLYVAYWSLGAWLSTWTLDNWHDVHPGDLELSFGPLLTNKGHKTIGEGMVHKSAEILEADTI